MIQKSHFWVYSQRNWKQGLKEICEHHVHSSTIHNHQQAEATQMSTYEWTGKQKWYTHTMYIPCWLSWSRIHLRCRRPQIDSWVTKIPGEMVGYPLQCSCLENPRDGGAWWAAVYGVEQSRTRLKQLSSSSSSSSSMSIESVMPSNHLILCCVSQHQALFQWGSSLHHVAKVLEFQLQYQSFQWTLRTDLLYDGLVGSPCSPRDSQESSPTT